MKVIGLLLMCLFVAFVTSAFVIGVAEDLQFYFRAEAVPMQIDEVRVSGRYETLSGGTTSSSIYLYDIEVLAHHGDVQRRLRCSGCQDAVDAKLLAESKGKTMVFWVLPVAEGDFGYKLQNDFPTMWLPPALIGLFILFLLLILFSRLSRGPNT